MAGGNADAVAASISAFLADKSVPPSRAWLQSIMQGMKLTTPVKALQNTALFRVLAADLQTSLDKAVATALPPDVTDPTTKETHVRGPITVQVLDVEDIGRSRWSQVEAIEAQDRGETTRGREVIRVAPEETGPDSTAAVDESKSVGPHKLLLQDARGTQVFAFEMRPVNGIGVHMSIGAKVVLRDVSVARGMMLIEPRNLEILGGKVEAWDKKWREERKQRLKQMAGMREGG
ncbi:hypothetical protein LTR53_012898 [Teratosphaeriaceae sp. CCFEE 6253]|nr:hypothetical protein LTR53_012898 [Teratosphaeriaceae sp. CCFEE 6253]